MLREVDSRIIAPPIHLQSIHVLFDQAAARSLPPFDLNEDQNDQTVKTFDEGKNRDEEKI